jgi:hypothetical protein
MSDFHCRSSSRLKPNLDVYIEDRNPPVTFVRGKINSEGVALIVIDEVGLSHNRSTGTDFFLP